MLSSFAFLCLVCLTLEIKAMNLVIKTDNGTLVEIINVVKRNSGSGNVWKGQLKAATAYWVEIKLQTEDEPTLQHQWEVFEALEATVTDVANKTEGEKHGILRAYCKGSVAAGSSEEFNIGDFAMVTDLPGINLNEYAMKNVLSAKEWAAIAYLMSRSVKYIHDHKVLHRNIHPGAFAFAYSETQGNIGLSTNLLITDVRFAKVKTWGVPVNGPVATVDFMSIIEHQMFDEANKANANGGKGPAVVTIETRRSDVQSTAMSIYFIKFRVFPWSKYIDDLYAYVNWTAPGFSKDTLLNASDRQLYVTLGIENLKFDSEELKSLTLKCFEEIQKLKRCFENEIYSKCQQDGKPTKSGIVLKQMFALGNRTKPYNLAAREQKWMEYWERINTPTKTTEIPGSDKTQQVHSQSPEDTAELQVDDEPQEDKPAQREGSSQTVNPGRNLLSCSAVLPEPSKTVSDMQSPQVKKEAYVQFAPTASRNLSQTRYRFPLYSQPV